MHQSDAYSSTSYSRGIQWLPSPEVCRMTEASDNTYNFVLGGLHKAESKIMFVCPQPPDPQFTPPTQKIILRFRGGKIFLSLAAKTSDSMPGIRF